MGSYVARLDGVYTSGRWTGSEDRMFNPNDVDGVLHLACGGRLLPQSFHPGNGLAKAEPSPILEAKYPSDPARILLGIAALRYIQKFAGVDAITIGRIYRSPDVRRYP